MQKLIKFWHSIKIQFLSSGHFAAIFLLLLLLLITLKVFYIDIQSYYSSLNQLEWTSILIISIIFYWNRRLAQEIKQRSLVEEELRKLSRAVEQSSNTIVITDINANIEFANPAFTKITGYSLKDALGKNPRILQSGHQDKDFYLNMWRVLAAGQVWHGELLNKRKDGSLYWENATISPIKDANGHVTHYVAVKENITARKHAEAALLANEYHLREIYDYLPVAYQSLDFQGRFLEVNRSLCNLLGYRAEELLGKAFDTIWSATTREHFNNIFSCFKHDGFTRGELEIIRKDGSMITILLQGIIQHNNQGEFARTHCILLDISERKRMEVTIRDSEALHRSLIAAMAEGVIVQNQLSEIVTCNDAAERILGLSQGQIIERISLDPRWHTIHEDGSIFPSDTHPAAVALRTGQPVHNVVMGIYKISTGLSWILINSEPLFKSSELIPYATVTTLSDITALKQAEKQKAINEARLDALLELNRRAPEMSEEALLRVGIESAERVTSSTCSYVHFINDDQVTVKLGFWSQPTMAQCQLTVDDYYPISKAGIWADSIRHKRAFIHNDYPNEVNKRGYPPGHVHLRRHMNVPVIDGDKVKIVVGMGNKSDPYNDYDMRQLQLIADDLWRIIARRRVMRELEQARQLAEKASKAKSIFLAHISHELRTPLSGILGCAQLLLMDATASTNQREYAKTIQNSGEYLLNLINEILDLSQIEADKLSLSVAPICLSNVLTRIVAMVKLRIETKGLCLRLECNDIKCNDAESGIQIDATRLSQILLNLLGNAIKFTQQGEIKLWARAELCSDNNRVQLNFAISDTGQGIPPEHLNTVLIPFERTPCQNNEGVGLGLSISSMLIKKMGGCLHLGSKTASGTWVATINKPPPIPTPAEHGTVAWFSLTVPFKIASNVDQYPENLNAIVNIDAKPPINPNMQIPPIVLIKQIYGFAKAGDIAALHKICDSIQIDYPDFSSKVLDYVEQFQLNELKAFIDSLISKLP